LALQTSAVVKQLGKHMNIECMVATGGTSVREDIYRLYKPVHILVGTVGRIYDLASKGACDLSHVTTLVLDECDKLLSSEFSSLLEEILTRLNREVQIMLFSATFPLIIKQFKDK